MPDSTALPFPTTRPLRVFAFDPSRGRLLGNEMQLDIRYRELAPGPVDLSGARDQISVVDYDATRRKFYRPVDLDDRLILIQNGLTPTECDLRFHQQMVYAVATDTVQKFEKALGRRIHWRRAERLPNAKRGWMDEDILSLILYPHAMSQANAFYSPECHGILFGYFQASGNNVGHNLPGQTVFTCLSHDVIVHEMTHAILDGLRGHFLEQTNADVAAFHEAFADLAALFRHFSHREVLLNAVQRTGGRLYTPALKGDPLADKTGESWLSNGEGWNPLIELAGQFGEAIGLREGLRSAIGKPKSIKELKQPMDCHERGSILVAAVFEAFFTIYLARAANHFRIYRAAGGIDRVDLPDPLALALCDEATRTAEQFFSICVRALDYLPPVDVTFGDFLRAVLTSEADFDPTDREGICDAWMQAFLRRQILPDDALYFSQDGLRYALHTDRVAIANLPQKGALGLNYHERTQTLRALRAFLRKPSNKKLLHLEPGVSYTIPSFHPLYRTDRSGGVRWDLVAEVVQTRTRGKGPPIRGGTTVLFSTHSADGGGREDKTFLRYIISKPLGGIAGQQRAKRQSQYFAEQGIEKIENPSSLRLNFALLHGGS